MVDSARLRIQIKNKIKKRSFFFYTINKLMAEVLCVQNAIAMHESNGIDIIIALLLNDINPLGRHRMDLVLELKVSLKLLGVYFSLEMYFCQVMYTITEISMIGN